MLSSSLDLLNVGSGARFNFVHQFPALALQGLDLLQGYPLQLPLLLLEALQASL